MFHDHEVCGFTQYILWRSCVFENNGRILMLQDLEISTSPVSDYVEDFVLALEDLSAQVVS
jgi:hypothetical protein